MFDHLVNQAPGLVQLAKALDRPLRVATMCSGTESPVLALQMMQRALDVNHGVRLGLDHVFSCEIEPFKQAYIERNFAPPILFRDIRELGQPEATTAYGAKVPVPGDCDMLVAGTSCVDYSNLNNEKKDLEAAGESGQTFRGMMKWVEKFQPPIVILENVCGAPWDKVKKAFEDKGYEADYQRVDTKFHYIPHTRTRVYLFATLAKGKRLTSKWLGMVKALERPSSSTLEAFLLPSDDPRVHNARRALAAPAAECGRTRTDWSRCESRHQRARLEEELGQKRPLTGWEEGGRCNLPDYAWKDWGKAQTDRVLDLMDIDHLRQAALGQDSAYKTLVWNLSQNVDRTTGSVRPGICPCLTPCMVPYVTNRGGPVVGLEALSLQGIPVDDLLLTKETQDQMADLAGNAMTTTVVGTCMVAALVLTQDHLLRCKRASRSAGHPSARDPLERSKPVELSCHDQLKEVPLVLTRGQATPLPEVLQGAQRSARKCICEARDGLAQSLLQCTDCGHSACSGCAGRPEHSYAPLTLDRLLPRDFEAILKAALPMLVRVDGLAAVDWAALRPPAPDCGQDLWNGWVEAVRRLGQAEFRFQRLYRAEVWTATYMSPEGRLELTLHDHAPEWSLTARPPDAPGPLRSQLLRPVARLRVDKAGQSIIEGAWELFLPLTKAVEVTVQGHGDQVDTWEARLGLQGKWAGTKRWNRLKVTAPPETEALLDGAITGDYRLHERCGTAMGSLHKKQTAAGERPMYLFLDPTRSGLPDQDYFVFAHSHRRLVFGEQRGEVARLDPSWRVGNCTDKPCAVTCHVSGRWHAVPEHVRFHMVATDGAHVATPPAALRIDLTADACAKPAAIVRCQVPLANPDERLWPQGRWERLDLLRSKAHFDDMAWFTQRLGIPAALRDWVRGTIRAAHTGRCGRCAPSPPDLVWVNTGRKLEPREDVKQAGAYEQALKHRPQPFVVQLRLDGRLAQVHIALNVPSLAHSALACFPARLRSAEGDVHFSWRLSEHLEHTEPLAPLRLTSNRHDPSTQQPPHFKKYPLRPEQLRSLSWMLGQEAAAAPFVQEEVIEAVLPQFGWRAEARVELPSLVRGGIVADQVGYGKTAITLGLIDSAPRPAPPVPAGVAKGHVPVGATLILCPGHLMRQWPNEVAKFMGKAMEGRKMVTLKTIADLNRLTIKDVQDADIVVAAIQIFRQDLYYKRLSALAGGDELPHKHGRHFDIIYGQTCEALERQVEALQTQGAKPVWEAVTAARRNRAETMAAAVELDAACGNTAKRLAVGKKATYKADEAYQATRAETKGNKRKAKAKGQAGESDSSDVDDEDDAPATKKAKGSAGVPSKAKEEEDPWGLREGKVRDNWGCLRCPPLELFAWARVVVDEFTYLQERDREVVCSGLQATFRWCLSGTPPTSNFEDVRGMARFLGLHLGVAEEKEKDKERTAAERFRFFHEVRTHAWHARRHVVAQQFMDRYVRQNIAEIDEIKAEEHLQQVTLTPAERAIYLELEHHLQAIDMKSKKTIKGRKGGEGDRESRLRSVLGASGSAEEALLKRCSHYDLDGNSVSAEAACQAIVACRQKQLDLCAAELRTEVDSAFKMYEDLAQQDPSYGQSEDEPFKRWQQALKLTGKEGCGDAEANAQLNAILAAAIEGAKKRKKAGAGAKSGAGKQTKAAEEALNALKWELRELVHQLRRLQKEMVGRIRSLRYFKAVRDLQGKGLDVACPACGAERVPVEKQVIFSCCGHLGCSVCMFEFAEKNECPVEGCTVPIRASNAIRVVDLGADQAHEAGGKYGTKLKKVVSLIKSLPATDRVLVFVQFPDLMQQVADAMDSVGLKALQLKGSVHTKTAALDEMQSEAEGNARVLLLNTGDESASGANLTNCNHAIFVHPLLMPTQQGYTACETQAIGRIRRYGQEKTVHVWRFIANATIDVDILRQRSRAWDHDMKTQGPPALAADDGAPPASPVSLPEMTCDFPTATRKREVPAPNSPVSKKAKTEDPPAVIAAGRKADQTQCPKAVESPRRSPRKAPAKAAPGSGKKANPAKKGSLMGFFKKS